MTVLGSVSGVDSSSETLRAQQAQQVQDPQRWVRRVTLVVGVVTVIILFGVMLWQLWMHLILAQASGQARSMNLPEWLVAPVTAMMIASMGFMAIPLLRSLVLGNPTLRDLKFVAVGALVWAGSGYMSFNNTPVQKGCDEQSACFGPAGQPLRWYSVEKDGRYALWNKPGRHPLRNTPLLPVSGEVVAGWLSVQPVSTEASPPQAVRKPLPPPIVERLR
jgi:hypothetical protein